MTGGQFQVADQSDFSDARTVAVIDAAPAEGELTVLPCEAAADARYLRYVSPDGGYGNVAEVQFFGTVISDTSIHTPSLSDNTVSSGGLYDLGGRFLSKPEARGVYITARGEKRVW